MIEVQEEQLEKSQKTFATMLDYLGLEASVKAEANGPKIVLIASSEDAGRIIGRKGQYLASLQMLLNLMMKRTDPDFPRVVIDVDGYSPKTDRKDFSREKGGRGRGDDRRRGGGGGGRGGYSGRGGDRYDDSDDNYSGGEEKKEQLRQQALDAAKEVKRWGEPMVMPAMNSHDRRIIHITLREDEEVQTESDGDGSMKKVIVTLKSK